MLPVGGAVTTLIWAGLARSVTMRWKELGRGGVLEQVRFGAEK